MTRNLLCGLRECAVLLLMVCLPAVADDRPAITPQDRILLLGDSNTYAGGYATLLETWLTVHQPDADWTIVNHGLPSETASGQSEPAHPFPRPCVHERLARALEKFHPTVVTIAYGMNDGIYYPPSAESLLAYQAGIIRAAELSQKAGARVYLLTPPMFDALPLKAGGKLKPAGEKEYAWFAPYAGYDETLGLFADWIRTQGPPHSQGVIDVRTPILQWVSEKRKTDPAYTMAGDGIHYDQKGHEIVARQIWKAWNLRPEDPTQSSSDQLAAGKIQPLVDKRQRLLLHSWLTHVGHQRPGIEAGLPLTEAEQSAAEIRKQIRQQLAH